MKVINQTIQQPVVVEEIIRGNESLEGETIFLQGNVQQTMTVQYTSSTNTEGTKMDLIGLRTNLMKEDVTYLVFFKANSL